MLDKYRDYFDIDPEYFPQVNEDFINNQPDHWKKFYPHETFVRLVKDTISVLSRKQRVSLWVEGAYGTGKSHAALVLQKLFMDDASRVNEWLEHRKELVPEAVRAALNTLRSNRVLAVFDTKSDGLKTPEQFLVRIENSIIQALKDNNYQIPAFGSLDKIIERIREEEGSFFKKRDELQGQLSILTSDIKTADALEKAKFLAAEKSSTHSKSYTFSVYFFAISFVPSVEPVSTIIISSAMDVKQSRQPARFFSSFFTIMQTLIVIPFLLY